jgi:hypothetical protein
MCLAGCVNSGDQLACNRCGLECPRGPDRHPGRRYEADFARLADLAQKGKWPRYFAVCPGCGADKRDADWPHLGGQEPALEGAGGLDGLPGEAPLKELQRWH